MIVIVDPERQVMYGLGGVLISRGYDVGLTGADIPHKDKEHQKRLEIAKILLQVEQYVERGDVEHIVVIGERLNIPGPVEVIYARKEEPIISVLEALGEPIWPETGRKKKRQPR